MAIISVSILTLCLIAGVAGQRIPKKLFCYYNSDAQYRQSNGKFLPENIDPYLCTHIIYAFFQPTDDGLGVKSVQWNDLGPDGMYARIVALKKQNPALRVLLAIGGWVIGSDPFLPVIASQNSVITFSRNVIKFLREHKMDGMDMDWEFPGVRGSVPSDKAKFTFLLKTLQEEFTAEAARTGREKLILTLASPAGAFFIGEGYEVEEVVRHPDYLLLMIYNYHGSWENQTGHHSAVWPSYLDQGSRRDLNMQWTLDFWLSKGAPRNKVILGVATYGMTFTLKNPAVNGLSAPAYGGGRGAKYTNEYGIMAFYEVCENLAKYGWQKVWIEDQRVPYAFGGDQWVGYDNQESLKIKVETLINGYNLAGAFVWSVEMDDFSGSCGLGKYPLLTTIVKTMNGGSMAPSSGATGTTGRALISPVPFIVAESTLTTTPAATKVKSPSVNCEVLGAGIYADPNSCSQFFYCVQLSQEKKFAQYTMRCPANLAFDSNYLTCVFDSRCKNIH